jgi:hypothetical protein
MSDMNKIAEKVMDIWTAVERIAVELDDTRELQRELGRVEAMFKFAENVLRNKERMLDFGLSIHRRDDGEIAIEAMFDGIHLHTEFLKPSDTLETVMQRFVDPNIALKAAIVLLTWALRESAHAIIDWHIKHF